MDLEKEKLIKQQMELKKYFNTHTFGIKYQQYIQSLERLEDSTIDETEYKVFRVQTIEKDVTPLCHALLQRVLTFTDFWDAMLTIVGFDLIVQSHLKQYKEDDKSNT
jgi:hypothetical protein